MVLSAPEAALNDQPPHPDTQPFYASPKLTRLGTLDELTQFSADGFVPDGDPSNNGFSLS